MNLIKFDAKHSGVTITNDMQAAAKRANAAKTWLLMRARLSSRRCPLRRKMKTIL